MTQPPAPRLCTLLTSSPPSSVIPHHSLSSSSRILSRLPSSCTDAEYARTFQGYLRLTQLMLIGIFQLAHSQTALFLRFIQGVPKVMPTYSFVIISVTARNLRPNFLQKYCNYILDIVRSSFMCWICRFSFRFYRPCWQFLCVGKIFRSKISTEGCYRNRNARAE